MATQKPATNTVALNATGWRDLTASGLAIRVGATAPDLINLFGNLWVYGFDASTIESGYLILHPNHDVKPGSGSGGIEVHVHWAPTNTNTGVVRWGFEYSYARGFSVDVFPAASTEYLEQAGSGVANTHQIVDSGLITIANYEPDGIILARIFRDATHVNDTYTGDAALLSVDIHYQSDRDNTSARTRGAGWDP